MTITRLGQLTAELQYMGDVITFGSVAPTISSIKTKTGGFSYRFGTTSDSAGLSFTPQAHVRAGMWFNHNGPQASSIVRVFTWREDGSEDLSGVRWDPSSNELILSLLGVTVDQVSVASIGFNTVDEWFHCGLHIHTGASANISFYLNGVEVLHYEGSEAGANVAELYFCGGTGAFRWQNSAYVDDFYVDGLTEGEPNVAPPAKRFLFTLVNGAGENAQWTPVGAASNYQAVDDPGGPDDDDTYNKTLDPELKDTFTIAGITVPVDHVIRAAIPVAIAKKTDAGGDQGLRVHAFNGIDYTNSGIIPLTVAYDTVWDRFPLQPDGTPWNEADFNAHEFGYESDLVV